MTREEQGAVGALLAITAETYGFPLPTHVIRLHLQDLRDLPFEPTIAAINQLRLEPGRTRMFRAADIIKRVQPEELPESPDEIALRAWGCLSKFGRTNAERARERIGPIGWETIGAMGGWEQVCMTTTQDDRGTWVAQFRNACSRVQERAPRPKALCGNTDSVASIRALTAKIGS